MSLFQSVVVNRYINELDAQLLEQAWQRFAGCFLDLAKQDNIRLSKEEQYQEGFLRDLFVNVFGYTLNPNPKYNLTTEFKNQTSSKKADGAILKDGHAIGVIELKGMNTTDMSKIEAQAFGYKNNQPKCRYVITSNFQKLRLYIDNAVEYEEFDLFMMSQDRFTLLYLLLCQTSMTADLPAKIKSESLSQEEAITKQLYKDYSVFKRELFADLTANNADIDALVLFQKSQKLLDRLLFIFFAEDSHLLPANFAKGIINDWQQLKKLKRNDPLYDQIKQYFTFLDTGYKDDYSEIFAYNGGLFSPDSLLDSVIISDEVLRSHILTLSEYDFDSEVDVNILGHIFENSLSELDEVKAQLAGEMVDKSQTKRKKDGVFYTPKYITKYIVENTVGKLCEDKKVALEVNEEDYQLDVTLNKSGKKRKKTDKRIAEEKEALDRLHAYRDWLLEITICDPACGSGAFLNEALNFLIAEHDYIIELETKLFGSGLAYPDIENSILENNLFGVDINEESVDIAKLSLWLRTAQPRRKLNNLNDNIQCGNSLIDDIEVAGEKAFNWQTAFPQVFAKGGFDVVIGNPPYVFARDNFSSEIKTYYSKNYVSAEYQINLYLLFIERAITIIKDSANFGLIVPNAWLMIESAQGLRKLILSKCSLEQIINLSGYSFDGVNVETIIIIASKVDYVNQSNAVKVFLSLGKEFRFSHQRNQIDFVENKGCEFRVFSNEESVNLTKKIKKGSYDLDDLVQIKAGLQAYEKNKGEPKQSAEDVKSRPYDYNYKYDEHTYEYLEGKDVGRYFINWSGQYLKYGKELASPRTFDLFSGEKIIVREITGTFPHSIISTYNENVYLYNRSNIGILNKENTNISLKYITPIINSKLIAYYFMKNTAKSVRKMFPKIILNDLRKFPIKNISLDNQKPFIVKADLMLSLNQQLQELTSKFIRTLQRKFEIDKLSKKLENWYELTYADFITELSKKKIKMSLGEESEWEEYFLAEQTKAQQLALQIERTDSEIDQMVYKLYDLTDDEIAIIEAS